MVYVNHVVQQSMLKRMKKRIDEICVEILIAGDTRAHMHTHTQTDTNNMPYQLILFNGDTYTLVNIQ